MALSMFDEGFGKQDDTVASTSSRIHMGIKKNAGTHKAYSYDHFPEKKTIGNLAQERG